MIKLGCWALKNKICIDMKFIKSFSLIFILGITLLSCQNQQNKEPKEIVISIVTSFNSSDLETAQKISCYREGLYADALIELTAFIRNSNLDDIEISASNQNYWRERYDSEEAFLKAQEGASESIPKETPYDLLYSVFAVKSVVSEDEIPLQVWQTQDIFSRDSERYKSVMSDIDAQLNNLDDSDPIRGILVSQKERAQDLKPRKNQYSKRNQCVLWHTIDMELVERQ